MEYEQNPDYDFLRQKFLDVMKGINEEMDYIYDWTTSTDLKKRKKKKIEKNPENNSDNEKNDEKDLESNNHDQLDRINTRQITKREDRHDTNRERPGGGEDKVESVCCRM